MVTIWIIPDLKLNQFCSKYPDCAFETILLLTHSAASLIAFHINHMYLMLCSIDYSSDMIVGKCYCGLTKMTTLIHTFFLLQTVKSIYLGVTSLVFEQRFQSLHLHFSYNSRAKTATP